MPHGLVPQAVATFDEPVFDVPQRHQTPQLQHRHRSPFNDCLIRKVLSADVTAELVVEPGDEFQFAIESTASRCFCSLAAKSGDTEMIGLAAWIFEYRTLPAACAMLVWAAVKRRKYPVSQRRWFRLAPLAFAAFMFGNVLYQPIRISSPQSGIVVHPGDKVQVTIQLRPAFLSVLFPSVNLDLPECWSCKAPPAGVMTSGTLTGSPYHFTIDLPRNLPPGVLVTSATAAPKGSGRAAMRSKFLELVVK